MQKEITLDQFQLIMGKDIKTTMSNVDVLFDMIRQKDDQIKGLEEKIKALSEKKEG